MRSALIALALLTSLFPVTHTAVATHAMATNHTYPLVTTPGELVACSFINVFDPGLGNVNVAITIFDDSTNSPIPLNGAPGGQLSCLELPSFGGNCTAMAVAIETASRTVHCQVTYWQDNTNVRWWAGRASLFLLGGGCSVTTTQGCLSNSDCPTHEVCALDHKTMLATVPMRREI